MKFNQNYYEEIVTRRQYETVDNLNLQGFSQNQLKNMWVCHDNGLTFTEFFKGGVSSIFSTGFGLSGEPHVGTISQIIKAIKLQKSGHMVQIVLGDIDTYKGKKTDFDYTQKLVRQYKNFIELLGFDNNYGVVRSQSEDCSLTVLRTSALTSIYAADQLFNESQEDMHSLYVQHNLTENIMTFNRKFSLNLMIADFVDLFISNKYENVMIFLGIDEHVYGEGVKKVVGKMKQSDAFGINKMNISALYSGIIKGFNNFPKMSKSFPGSSINLAMSAEDITSRIMNEEGSFLSPEDNVVYQMIQSASFFDNDEIREAYKACKLNDESWGYWKCRYASELIDMLSKWKQLGEKNV